MKKITIDEIIEFIYGLDEYPDYDTPAYNIRAFEYDILVSHQMADWINNEGLGCYRPDEPEGDYNQNETETITISAEEYIDNEFKSDIIAHLYTEDLEDGVISKEALEAWINLSLNNCVDFFNNFTITNPDEDEVLYLEIKKDIYYKLEMLNPEWTDKEFNVSGFNQLEDSPRIKIF